MSRFWSGWVMFLVVLNLGITLFLFVWAQRLKIPTRSDGTTGHVWAHGVLREGVRKLPLWWVLISAAMFIVGFTYLVLYPGFGAYAGRLAGPLSVNGRDTHSSNVNSTHRFAVST